MMFLAPKNELLILKVRSLGNSAVWPQVTTNQVTDRSSSREVVARLQPLVTRPSWAQGEASSPSSRTDDGGDAAATVSSPGYCPQPVKIKLETHKSVKKNLTSECLRRRGVPPATEGAAVREEGNRRHESGSTAQKFNYCLLLPVDTLLNNLLTEVHVVNGVTVLSV